MTTAEAIIIARTAVPAEMTEAETAIMTVVAGTRGEAEKKKGEATSITWTADAPAAAPTRPRATV